jgi:hypothetical protein
MINCKLLTLCNLKYVQLYIVYYMESWKIPKCKRFCLHFLCTYHKESERIICFVVFTNYKSANGKSAKCHICGRSANLTNYISPPSCGFAICGTYLRTAHLWHSPSIYLHRLPCTVKMFESALNKLIKYSLLLSRVILL